MLLGFSSKSTVPVGNTSAGGGRAEKRGGTVTGLTTSCAGLKQTLTCSADLVGQTCRALNDNYLKQGQAPILTREK
jgi:hypothetical protein